MIVVLMKRRIGMDRGGAPSIGSVKGLKYARIMRREKLVKINILLLGFAGDLMLVLILGH